LVTISRDGATSRVFPDIYTGSVFAVDYEITGTANSEVVFGTSRNDFINLMRGDDVAVGREGDDVIDGGTGSSLLTGGSGRDEFYLDGRGPGPTWSTITDWQPGERLWVWGWRPGVSQVIWRENEGEPGRMGVTMHADLNGDGLTDTSVTWTGLTRSQLPTPLQLDDLLWFT